MAAQPDEGGQTATDSTSIQWPQPDSSLLRVDDDSVTWNSDEAWEPDTEPLESDTWGPVYNEPAGPAATKKRRRRRGVPPYLVHEKEDLRPYRKYRQLIGEFKFQRPVKKPQKLSFLDLPAEIRVMVYENAFVSGEPLELWAEAGDVYKDQRLRRRNAAIMKHKVFNNRRGCVNLGFMRTCKQVNIEATKVFYGHNEFRFSGKNGHMAAFAFVTKIGSRNLDFMRSITMALPIESPDEGMYGENWNPSNWRRIHEVYDRMPFPYSPKPFRYRKQYKRLQYGAAWCHLAEKLASAHCLKTITFVLPDECCFRYHSEYDRKANSAFDDLFTAKPFLKLQIVRLMVDEENTDDMPKSNAEWVVHLLNLAKSCMQSATAQLHGRWSLTGQPYVNKHGRLAIVEDLEWTETNTEIIKDIWRLFG